MRAPPHCPSADRPSARAAAALAKIFANVSGGGGNAAAQVQGALGAPTNTAQSACGPKPFPGRATPSWRSRPGGSQVVGPSLTKETARQLQRHGFNLPAGCALRMARQREAAPRRRAHRVPQRRRESCSFPPRPRHPPGLAPPPLPLPRPPLPFSSRCRSRPHPPRPRHHPPRKCRRALHPTPLRATQVGVEKWRRGMGGKAEVEKEQEV